MNTAHNFCRFKDFTLCICSCLPSQCVPLCECWLTTPHWSSQPWNLKLKEAPLREKKKGADTNQLGLWSNARSQRIHACMTGCCSNEGGIGLWSLPPCPPLTLDRWTRLLFPPFPCLYGTSNYAYTPHQNGAQHAMPLYGEEVSWSNVIKSRFVKLACNFGGPSMDLER